VPSANVARGSARSVAPSGTERIARRRLRGEGWPRGKGTASRAIAGAHGLQGGPDVAQRGPHRRQPAPIPRRSGCALHETHACSTRDTAPGYARGTPVPPATRTRLSERRARYPRDTDPSERETRPLPPRYGPVRARDAPVTPEIRTRLSERHARYPRDTDPSEREARPLPPGYGPVRARDTSVTPGIRTRPSERRARYPRDTDPSRAQAPRARSHPCAEKRDTPPKKIAPARGIDPGSVHTPLRGEDGPGSPYRSL
jgi:hypothetical protein